MAFASSVPFSGVLKSRLQRIILSGGTRAQTSLARTRGLLRPRPLQMENIPELGVQPSSGMLDDVEFEDALGQTMATLNEESIDGRVASCIEQAEQEVASEPLGLPASHSAAPPTSEELEDYEQAAHLGSWIGQCSNQQSGDRTMPEFRLPGVFLPRFA